MIVNIVVLAVFFLSLSGILFIVGKKLFFLTKIDLSRTPEEIAAKTKKELLKKKVSRQIRDFEDKFKLGAKGFWDCFKKGAGQIKVGTNRVLEVSKKLVKIIRKFSK